MKYRKLGKIDFSPSALGFGTMRLPTSDGTMSAPVLEEEAVSVIRHAIDIGVNYIDTAYLYHGGVSERVVGTALGNGYREKVGLATKSPVWLLESPGDFDKLLDEQLTRLNTDYIDFYLLHALDAVKWEKRVLRFDLIKKALDAKKAGKIKYIGFSFHDEYPVFEKIVNHFDWDLCQIQLNYLNESFQAGLKGLQLAAAKNLGVVIMEPLFGGKLVKVPSAVRDILSKAGMSPVKAALDYLWNMPGVSTVLSGMNTMEQVDENAGYAGASEVGGMSPSESDAVKRVIEYHDKHIEVRCTNCQYCMPCPSGVDIPTNISMYNESKLYEDQSVVRGTRNHLSIIAGSGIFSDNCTACAACEEKCPQIINIRAVMQDLTNMFNK